MQEKILVPLEEVKKKDFGIGDDYWDDGDSQRKRKKDKGKGRETQEVSQRSRRELAIEGRPKSRAAEKASRMASEVEDELGAGDVWAKGQQPSSDSDLEIVAPPPKKAAAASSSRSQRTQTQSLVDKTNETQNLDLPSSKSASGKGSKRVAEKVLMKPAPVKKAKPMKVTKVVQGSDESDEDDGLKFRFKKR